MPTTAHAPDYEADGRSQQCRAKEVSPEQRTRQPARHDGHEIARCKEVLRGKDCECDGLEERPEHYSLVRRRKLRETVAGQERVPQPARRRPHQASPRPLQTCPSPVIKDPNRGYFEGATEYHATSASLRKSATLDLIGGGETLRVESLWEMRAETLLDFIGRGVLG